MAAGAAGFLAAISLKKMLPHLGVTVLRSKEIGIIGVGEGTTIPFLNHLHGYLGIDHAEFHQLAKPTWKLAVRFQWGPRRYFDYGLNRQLELRYPGLSKIAAWYADDTIDYGFSSTLMTLNRVFPRKPDGTMHVTRDPAYHLENAHLVHFLETYSAKLGVKIKDDTVIEVKQNELGVEALVLESGEQITADLYVDSSGFRAELLGKAFDEPFVSFKSSLFCDRAVVGGWDRGDEPTYPYTVSDSMNAGWSWRIDHENRINRGYVYSSSFISDEEAEREFRGANPKIASTRIVKFVSGRRARSWVKNVVGIGNAVGFVEPLEATSLAAICLDAHALTELLRDCDQRVTLSQVSLYNRRSALTSDLIRQFLAVHYKFNGRLDTPFWRECQEKTDICDAEPFVEFYRENGPSTLWERMILDARDPFGFEGYLSMMVGLGVKSKKKWTPSAEEAALWNKYLSRLQTVAKTATTVGEALEIIRSPRWKWPANPYTG